MPTLLSLLIDDLCASPCCNLFVYNSNSYEKYVQQISIQRYELLPGWCEEFCRSEQCLCREGCCLCMTSMNFLTCCFWEQYVGIRQQKAVLNATYDTIARFNKYLFRPRGIDVRLVRKRTVITQSRSSIALFGPVNRHITSDHLKIIISPEKTPPIVLASRVDACGDEFYPENYQPVRYCCCCFADILTIDYKLESGKVLDAILEKKYGSPDGNTALLPPIEAYISTQLHVEPNNDSVDDINRSIDSVNIRTSPSNKSQKLVKVHPEGPSADPNETKYYTFSFMSWFNIEPVIAL